MIPAYGLLALSCCSTEEEAMKLGLAMFVTAHSIDVVSLARKAKACGFDSL